MEMSRGMKRRFHKLFKTSDRANTSPDVAKTIKTRQNVSAESDAGQQRRRKSSVLSVAGFLRGDFRKSSSDGDHVPVEHRTKQRPQTWSCRPHHTGFSHRTEGEEAPRRCTSASRDSPLAKVSHDAQRTKEEVRQATLDALNGSLISGIKPASTSRDPNVFQPARQLPIRPTSAVVARTQDRRQWRDSGTSDGRGRSLSRKSHVDDLRDSARRHRDESDHNERKQSGSRECRGRKQHIRKSSLSKPLPGPPGPIPPISDWNWDPPLKHETSLEAMQRISNVFMGALNDAGVDLSNAPVHNGVLWGGWGSSVSSRPEGASPDVSSTREAAARRSEDLVRSLQDDGLLDLSNTNETHTAVLWSPAVTHETNIVKPIEVLQPAISREVHSHHFLHRVLPIVDMEVLPARHFIPDADGGYLEISEDEIPGGNPDNLHQVIADAVMEYNPRKRVNQDLSCSTDGTVEGNGECISGTVNGSAAQHEQTGTLPLTVRSVATDAHDTEFRFRTSNGLPSWMSIVSKPPPSESILHAPEMQEEIETPQATELAPNTIPIHTILPIRVKHGSTEDQHMPLGK